jgi:hypothetical protein
VVKFLVRRAGGVKQFLLHNFPTLTSVRITGH